MKTCQYSLLVFAVCCSLALGADNTSLKKLVRDKAEEISNATLKGDFAKVADLTHPAVVKLMGGRENMIKVMESSTKDMKSQGFTFRSTKVEEPTNPVKSDSDMFVIVPFHLEMKAPGGKLKQKSFVIGVSSNDGKSWFFVNGDLDIKKIKQVLPNLPDRLKLPEKQKPVFEKD